MCHAITTDRRLGLVRLAKVQVEPEYYPAFGKVIKNKAHLRGELSKAKDEGREMIAIGDESSEKMERNFAKQREETRNRRWNAEPVEKLMQDVMHGR